MFQDIRYGLRTLRKNPAFTVVAALSLAAGIGANTAIFSVLDAVVLRTLPVRSPEQLVLLNNYGIDYPLLARLRDLPQVFDGVAASILTDRFGADSAPTTVGLVTGNYFQVLGADTAMGRTLGPDDDRIPGGHPVAVISYAYWENQMARAPNPLGRGLKLGGITYTIIGVTPRGFSGDRTGRPADLWIPAMMESQVMPGCHALRCGAEIRIIGRLQAGVTLRSGQAAAEAVVRQFEIDQGQARSQARLELQPLARGYAPQLDSLAQSLSILMMAAALVLLIACANVANLLLARAAARRREIAVRRAIGASAGRIVRQLLTESMLLAAMGSALGMAFAAWGTKILTSMLSSAQALGTLESRLALEVHPDGRTLAFTGALCVLTGLLFGTIPAFRGSSVSLSPALTGRGAGSARQSSLGKGLVISQIALSLVALISTGLFVRTLRNLKTQKLGLDSEHLLLVWSAPVQTGRQGAALADLWRAARTRVSSLPGVLAASVSNTGVLNGIDRGGPSESMRIEGQLPKPGMGNGWVAVMPGFFESTGMQMLAGRDFSERDNESAPRVAIVNEAMARFYFGDESPIGRRFAKPGETGYPWEIVGVVADVKHGTPRGHRLQEYFPYRQDLAHLQTMCVTVHTARDPAGMKRPVQQELRAIDPNLPVAKIDTAEEQLSDVLVRERVTAAFAGFFGVLAVLLACLGLYGVISYGVSARTNEIGIRMALGARQGDVLTMILRQGLVLVLAGITLGLPLTVGATRLIANQLFGVGAADPVTICSGVVLLIAVATAAGMLPARRAVKIDPTVALRHE